jgi:hypothetical protein
VKPSHAITLLPGGFGTHDEGFEALTLIQTGKSEPMPIVCLDAPGGDYWQAWDEYVRRHLADAGLINESDLSLYHVTDDVEDAVHHVLNFYSNYHSSRFVRDRLYMRLRQSPDAEQLEDLNVRFGDIVTKGRIEVVEAEGVEGAEAPLLPRLAFDFDRRAVGRLRQLVDRVNTWVPVHFSPAEDACAHELVPGQVPEDFEDIIW